MTIAAIAERLKLDSPSPLLKQAPTAILFAIAVLVIAVVPGATVSDASAVVLASFLMVVVTAFAAFLATRPSLQHLALAIPAVDFLAIGAFESGTGAGHSAFSVLVILPIVWFASEEGRRFIVWAVVGLIVTVLMPLAWGHYVVSTFFELMRVLFSIGAFAIAATVINELSRQARLQLASIRRLAEHSRKSLEETTAHAKELAKSEANLREAERMFRGVWAAVTEQSVIGTDVTGLIDAWNPGAARLLGATAAEIEDLRHVDEFHLPDELEDRARDLQYPAGATVLNPGFSALVEPARLGNADVREWTYVRNDGTHIPVELSVTARRGESGEVVGYLFVAYDMTKAREVAKLKDDFVGLISHELRTPLSSILGYLELMRDDDETELSPTQLQYLAVAERNAHRLLTLVGDLLFTAQVESGKFNLEQHVQGLSPIVAAAVDSARPAAAAAGVTLRTEIVEGGMVRGDSVRLGQACDNLISNALKFTPRGGTVTVGVTATASDAVLTVTDTGIGIAESELDQLFSRFFRATTATRNAVPGVGLGLVITKAIITAHGGAMGVTSEEGVGTCFSVTLPLAELAKV